MHIKNKRGQSTVEYVLLVTAVIVVIIAFVGTQHSAFQNRLSDSLGQVANGMNTEATAYNTPFSTLPDANSTPATPPPYSVSVCGGAGQPPCAPAPAKKG